MGWIISPIGLLFNFVGLPHNTHLEKPDAFIKQDPHLNQLNKQALVHRSQLLDQIPRYISGIYTLRGGRQTGKTTLLKQWTAELLESRVPPKAIAYMTGELVDDHHSLYFSCGKFLGKTL